MYIPEQVFILFQRQGMTRKQISAVIEQGHRQVLELARQHPISSTPKTPQDNLQDLEAILESLQGQVKQTE